MAKTEIDNFAARSSVVDADTGFYYGDPKSIGRGREIWAEVRGKIQGIQSQLDELAKLQYTAWQPACEACNRYRDWWNIFNVAAHQSDDMSRRRSAGGSQSQDTETLVEWSLIGQGDGPPTGRTAVTSIDVKKLTKLQVEFKGATDQNNIRYWGISDLVEQYNALAKVRPRGPVTDANQTNCRANLLPDVPAKANATGCILEDFEQGIDIVVGRMIRSLNYALQLAKANRISDAENYPMQRALRESKGQYNSLCPRSTYPNNGALWKYE